MTTFWIIAGGLLVFAVALLVVPMWRAKDKVAEGLRRRDINIEVYRSQLKELQRDLDNGIIDAEQFEQAKADLERGMAEDVLLAEEDGPRRVGRGPLIAATAAVLVIVPAVSVGLYQELGGGLAAIDPERVPPPVAADEHQEVDIEAMVAQLAERMKSNPDDIEGWFMLGRSYQFLNRYQEAKEAYDRVLALGGGSSPDFLATYADVLAMLNDRHIGEDSMRYIQQALAIDPNHVKALWLAGTASFQRGDYETTLKYWERLVQVLPPGSEDARTILSNVNALRAQLGMGPMSGPIAAAKAQVSGVVEIAPDLRDRVSPDDTVFIFARAVDGPRMPLAIMRVQVKDLPMHFTLDDSRAMTPMANLSAFPEVVVGARVSKSGDAMPRPGDLEGLSDTVRVADAGEVRIVIDRVIQ